MQGNAVVERSYSQSVEGARGPLPDLIQPAMRNRAYSESAIYTAQMVEHVGVSLRNMCDQFTETHTVRQRNLALLVRVTHTPPGPYYHNYNSIDMGIMANYSESIKFVFSIAEECSVRNSTR